MLIDITDTVQLTHTAAEVDADIDGSVRGDVAQLKDDTWKAQARENIGAGTDSASETELLDLKMLGWTVPKDSPIQNFKDDNGVYHQRVGRVDLGSLTWNYESAYQTFYSNDFPTPLYNNQTLGYCYKYSVTPIAFDVMPDKFISTWWQNFSTNFRVLLKDLSFSSPASLKESLQGVYLYYELTTEITRPIDGGEWVARYSNPNLLDNWWFGEGVVNQRNVSVWSSGYGIDRWKAIFANVTLTSNGLSLASNSAIMQFIENPERLNGKTITLSILYADGTIEYTSPFVFKTDDFESYTTPSNLHIRIGVFPSWSLSSPGVIIYNAGSSAKIIKAVKLELGSVSTLANDSAPDYATELLKCKGHCVVLKGDSHIFAVGFTSTNLLRCDLLETLNFIPNGISLEGGAYVYSNGTIHNVTSIALSSNKNIDVTLATNLTANHVGVLRAKDSTTKLIIYDSIGGR